MLGWLPGRVARVLRPGLVVFFLCEALGVAWFAFWTFMMMPLAEMDGPPVPESTKKILTLATLVAISALVGAAIEATDLLRGHGFVVVRVATLVVALGVNVYGFIVQSRWFLDLVSHAQSYRQAGFETSDFVFAAAVVLVCAIGGMFLVLLGAQAIGRRPKSALLVDT